jgi:hypothetical protein
MVLLGILLSSKLGSSLTALQESGAERLPLPSRQTPGYLRIPGVRRESDETRYDFDFRDAVAKVSSFQDLVECLQNLAEQRKTSPCRSDMC